MVRKDGTGAVGANCRAEPGLRETFKRRTAPISLTVRGPIGLASWTFESLSRPVARINESQLGDDTEFFRGEPVLLHNI